MLKKMCTKIYTLCKYPFQWVSNFLFYRKFLGTYKLFFDIGANVGFKTGIFRQIGASVVSVEPQTKCFDVLSSKFGSDKRVHLVKKGIASSSGFLEIHISKSSAYISTFSDAWQSSGRFSDFSFDDTEKVEMITLDTLIDMYGVPDFVKVDVEGFERQVFDGLTKKIPCVSFEFTSEFFSDSRLIVEKLKTLGFSTFNYCAGEKMKLQLSVWVGGDELLNILSDKISQDSLYWGDVYAK